MSPFLVIIFGVVLFKITKLNLLVSLHEEVCINLNFIYYLLLSLSLPLSVSASILFSVSLCISLYFFLSHSLSLSFLFLSFLSLSLSPLSLSLSSRSLSRPVTCGAASKFTSDVCYSQSICATLLEQALNLSAYFGAVNMVSYSSHSR